MITPGLEALQKKIAEFTIGATGSAIEPRSVIVVPLGADLEKGIREAKRRLTGGPVRLVGHGVTLRFQASHEHGIWLTELGAYRTQTFSEPSDPIREALVAWTDAVFAGIGGNLRGSEALYPAAAQRLLAKTMDLRGIAEGIALAHRAHDVVIVGAWPDLAQLLGRRPSRSRLAHAAWMAGFPAVWTVALAGTLWREAQTRRAEFRSRRALRDMRSSQTRPAATEEHRDVWVALIPELIRLNRHVIEGIALPALRDDKLRGILVVESLRDGMRTETRLASHATDDIWPGFGVLRNHLARLQLDQAARPDAFGEYVVDLGLSVLASTKAMLRIAASGPFIRESEHRLHGLTTSLWPLAALATIDVSRAVTGRRAATRLLKRETFAGKKVVFVSCSTPSTAAACSFLNQAGATTIDFFHGGGIEQVHGGVESPAKLHATWTKLDADAFRSIGRGAVEAGMTIRVRPRPRTAWRRVLIMSNYSHRDEPMPHAMPFQDELLRITTLAPADVEFRWRPHPADDPVRIARTLRHAPSARLSNGTALEDDVDWADVVVSSMSSAAIEALFGGAPVFFHIPPHIRDLHVFRFVAGERAFFRAEDWWPKVVAARKLRDAGQDELAAERAARAVLFEEPDGWPRPLDAALGEATARHL